MKIFDDMKYIGKGMLAAYGDTIWHCTSSATELSTGNMKYLVQKPHYHDGIFIGYTTLDIYVLTKEELVRDFKIVDEKGNLKDIMFNKQ